MTDARRALNVLRVAQVFAGISVAALAITIFTDPAATVATRSTPSNAARDSMVVNERVVADAARLIARDPFSPLREAPPNAYRIAGPSPVRVAAAPSGTVVLLGTIVQPSARSFVMARAGSEAPRVVYPGDRIGTLKLEWVQQGSAGFIDESGREVVLKVQRSGG